MNINDLIVSAVEDARNTSRGGFCIARICRAATKIYKNECVTPDFTSVKFSSIPERTTEYRTHFFRMLVCVLPGHPYFRPWLQPQAARAATPLYLMKLTKDAPSLALCSYAADTDLEWISQQAEKEIVQKVQETERYIEALNQITEEYGLSESDAFQFHAAIKQLAKATKFEEGYFLLAENREFLLTEEK